MHKYLALRSIMIAKIVKIIINAQKNCKKCKNICQNAIIIAKIFVKAQKCLMMIHTILMLMLVMMTATMMTLILVTLKMQRGELT